MTELIDGNNVLIRAMTGSHVPGQAKISIRQRLSAAGPQQLWIWDGTGHNARRQAVYAPYKMQRPPMGADLFSQINLFKAMLCHTAATQITVEGYEADDVIATIVRSSNRPFKILTNDQDYAQLLVFPNVTLYGVKRPTFDPRFIPLYKATKGDSSDNIAGIPGFGPKSWEATESYRDQLQAAVVSGRFEDFSALPLPKSTLTWLVSVANRKTLQDMLTITVMWDVPADQLNLGITAGTPNPELIDKVLRKYFL